MQIRIIGTDLPGRDCPPGHNFPGYPNVHVAVQSKKRPPELLDLQPGDASEVTWTIECDVNGSDVRGPYVQGRPGDRFIYLNWGSVDADGRMDMFRRAKLMLDAVPADVLANAVESGTLVGRLGLTDAKGQPLCAAVRPPAIGWSVG
ncbi:monooxygenase [Mycolicibacterium moriokaense]|nr:monooxygenase [Mycolicibacterium moriokaense]